MFQTFEASSHPEQGPPRLAALRKEIAREGLDGFLVPRADAHQGEYVAPHDARLEWLTGFSGSAGFAVVLEERAAIFVDGRYRVQARAEVAAEITPVHWPETGLADWLPEALPQGGKLGFDPWLHTVAEIEDLSEKLQEVRLCPVENLVDRIWEDQPAPPEAPFTVHPDDLAGEAHGLKRRRVGEALKAGAAVLTLPDSIAWLLNIRGTDIPRNPVPHAFALLFEDGRVTLFARGRKAEGLREHLGPDVALRDVSEFEAALEALTGSVQIDPKSCPARVAEVLEARDIDVVHAPDPCILPKALKNAAEVAGARAAALRDGVAMVRFLHWLDRTAPQGALTEIDVVTALEGFRRETNALRDISFETIAGAGPNGAIVHYRVNEKTDRAVGLDDLLLVDSGGQYADGTTDITRTMVVGTPRDEHRRFYTRVLQGLIALSRARFPKGVTGADLDALARAPLWMDGCDYDHGTGHGIGSYLSVHEGPQGISRRSRVALEPGMILSNEPGYYREGDFGIRIENLMLVVEAPALPQGDDRRMFAFETLTHVPLDRRLIDTALLSQNERAWIDAYHAETRARLAPRLDGEVRDWLEEACAPL